MKTLREAAQAVVDKWDRPLASDLMSTSIYINALRKALEAPEQEPDIKALQAAGKGPSPCARFCEAQAFKVEIRNAASDVKVLQAKYDFMLQSVRLLEVEIDAMTKERDALTFANKDLTAWFDALRADHDKLTAAGKLALEALEHVQWKNWRTDKAITELLRAGVE